MATIDLGKLFVRIGADTKDLNDKLARSEARAKRFEGAIRKAFAFAGISVGLGQLTNQTRRAIQQLDNIGKTADKIGVSTQALQELRFAADQSGVAANTLDMALQRFTRRSAEAAQGTGEAKAALEQMGIQLTDNEGRMRKTEDLLSDVSAAFQNVGSDAERVRLAFKLFDSEGVALVNTLNKGPEALQKWRQQAVQLGIVLDESMIRKAEELQDKLSQADQIVRNELTKAFVNLGPVLINSAKAIGEVVRWINNAIVAAKQLAFLLDKDVSEFKRLTKAIAFNEAQMKSAEATMKAQIELYGEESAVVAGQRAEIERLRKETEQLVKVRKELAEILLPKYDSTASTDGGQPKPEPLPTGLSEDAKKEQENFFKTSQELLNQLTMQRRAFLETNVQMLTDSLRTEREAIIADYEERDAILREAEEKNIDSEVDYFDLRLRLAKEKVRKLNEVEEAAAMYRRMILNSELNATKSILGDLGAALESFGIKNHAVQKAFAISSALIDTYQAIAKAQAAYPPPVSYFWMAAAAIRGFAQVAAIIRTGPKSSSGGSSAAAGAAAPAAAQQVQPQRALFVRGVSADSLFTGAQVQQLSAALLDFQKDGGKVVFEDG